MNHALVAIRAYALPICLSVVTFGPLLFMFARSELPLLHPSWPFWIGLGLSTAVSVIGVRRLSVDDLLFGAFALSQLLSFLFLGNGDWHQFLVQFVFYIILPYTAARSFSDASTRHYMVASATVCAATALVVFYYLVMHGGGIDAERVILFAQRSETLVAGDPTAFNIGVAAGFLCIASIAAILAFRTEKTFPAPLLVVVVAGGFSEYVDIVAGSRTSLLAIAGTALYLLVAYKAPLVRKVIVVVALSIVPIGLLSLSVLPRERTAFLAGSPTATEEAVRAVEVHLKGCERYGDSWGTRIVYLRDAVRQFLQHPIFGVGSGNYGMEYCGSPKVAFASPHNIVAHVAAENGIIGLALLLGLLARCAYIMPRVIKSPSGIYATAALAFFLITALVVGNIFQVYYFYAAMGMLFALHVQDSTKVLVDIRQPLLRVRHE